MFQFLKNPSTYLYHKPSPFEFEPPVVTVRDMNPQTVDTALFGDVEQTVVLVEVMVSIPRTEGVQTKHNVTQVFAARHQGRLLMIEGKRDLKLIKITCHSSIMKRVIIVFLMP